MTPTPSPHSCAWQWLARISPITHRSWGRRHTWPRTPPAPPVPTVPAVPASPTRHGPSHRGTPDCAPRTPARSPRPEQWRAAVRCPTRPPACQRHTPLEVPWESTRHTPKVQPPASPSRFRIALVQTELCQQTRLACPPRPTLARLATDHLREFAIQALPLPIFPKPESSSRHPSPPITAQQTQQYHLSSPTL